MDMLPALAAFVVVCLASYMVGQGFKKLRLPTITGYLFAGALAGSFGVGFMDTADVESLRFVDEISLAVIAFVAGSELYLKELRPRIRPILSTTAGILVVGFGLLVSAIYIATEFLPFTSGFSTPAKAATALLGGAVLLALSPPSTIAVIKEMRARGPFTRTALGVTVLMDVAIIVLFAAMASIAAVLLTDESLDLGFVGLLLLDLAAAATFGIVTGYLLRALLSLRIHPIVKIAGILALGFGIYELAGFVGTWSLDTLGFEIYIEPLLIALIGGFFITNFTDFRLEFDRLLHDVGPAVYVAFFTITGLALKLDVLWATLPVALALFAVRVLGIGIGSGVGSALAGESKLVRRTSWMAFITQAGIALGLAREVSVQFPDLGDAFATLIISVVVINEVVGPLFLKSGLKRVGETNLPEAEAEGGKVVIFGVEGQSIALARVLMGSGWDVVVADTDPGQIERIVASDVEEVLIPDLSEETLTGLIDEEAAAVVAMLPDDGANYEVLRFAYERRGVERLVARPVEAASAANLTGLGAFVVDPSSAMVTLLEQAVLSPQSTALLLHRDPDRTVAQVTVTNRDVHGMSLRHLRLPTDVLILEVRRGDSTVLAQGSTVFRVGDEVTLVAEQDSLEAVRLTLGG
jgi:Trk K+ transport system NAD-binding subunit/Kef-type K+ transport system membrane component KefB